jgi:hypothetical protein
VVWGVPVGGTTGQALVKTNNTDYCTEWSTISGGGGTYEYFNTSTPTDAGIQPTCITGQVNLINQVNGASGFT